MTGSFSGVLLFVGIFGAGLLAMRVQRMLPSHHLSADTKDVVKVTMGMVATMTALMLGLLVSSAKDKFADEEKAVMEMAAKLSLIDRTLSVYGAQAQPIRTMMRNSLESGVMARYWPQGKAQSAQLVPDGSSAEALYFAVQQLSPQNDAQRALKEFALNNMYDISQTRWMIAEQASSSVSVPLLVFVVGWLVILFFSFGLFAPANGTVVIAFMVAAVSVSSAVFLILELDEPFGGLIKISSHYFVNVLKLMGN